MAVLVISFGLGILVQSGISKKSDIIYTMNADGLKASIHSKWSALGFSLAEDSGNWDVNNWDSYTAEFMRNEYEQLMDKYGNEANVTIVIMSNDPLARCGIRYKDANGAESFKSGRYIKSEWSWSDPPR